MSTAIEVSGVTRRYRNTMALDQVSVAFEKNMIHGLLGRNGAGKTTLMSLITAQDWPTAGDIRVFGKSPHENEQILPHICFVREEQQYMDDAKAHHAFRAAALSFPNWDQELCDRLIRDFKVPPKTRIKKMSRGQRSAVGVIIGLASRAEVTFFDEPYMGLDAVARQLFYDRLLEDYAQHPRTIVLSSHLIDEVAHLIENVVLIDQGRIILDEPVEDLRDRAVTLVGRAEAVAEIAAGREVLHEETMGRMARTTVLGALDDGDRRRIEVLDLDVVPVSLQQLVVRLTEREQKEVAR
ncbi:ABC transporter ATP-binding protein [Nesterenkonia sp. HG001]|uniref:ABC transporter ATP-binding protein n=1 Tax=Nesterenkonia sp. HG001 TaxID=2983207 RepID=UPI002AC5E486|nr:ABC transporter ATP-binding protein [Nesterenkonia sp. HG001]MDZ5077531.1 ABC transporter ATP-binding protein [Nesterenkonia sp. HG001]